MVDFVRFGVSCHRCRVGLSRWSTPLIPIPTTPVSTTSRRYNPFATPLPAASHRRAERACVRACLTQVRAAERMLSCVGAERSTVPSTVKVPPPADASRVLPEPRRRLGVSCCRAAFGQRVHKYQSRDRGITPIPQLVHASQRQRVAFCFRRVRLCGREGKLVLCSLGKK